MSLYLSCGIIAFALLIFLLVVLFKLNCSKPWIFNLMGNGLL